MKKVLLLTAMCLIGLFTVKAQETSFSYNFDDGSMTGWETFQKSNMADGPNWAVSDADDTYYSGYNNSRCIYSMSVDGNSYMPYYCDNYIMTTEKYLITESSVLSWFARHTYANGNYEYMDPYDVYVSEDGVEFTKVWGGYAIGDNNESPEYTESYTFAPEFVGKELYICFWHYGSNGDAICIDNITLEAGSDPGPGNEGLSEVITIGEDSPQFINSIPFNCWYGNSISQQIYTKEEINFMNGDVTKVAFMQRTTASYTRDLVIYMINTDKEDFTGWYDWAELSTSDIVFQGEVTTTTADTWLEIELQNKFYYEGDNLLICVQDNTNDYDDWFEFQVFETDTVRRTLANARDSKPYDINNLTEADGAAGNTMTIRSSVQFTIEYQEGLSVFPEEISLGDIQLGEYWPEKEEVTADVTVYSGGVAVTEITCDNDFFIIPEDIDMTAEPIKFVVGYDKTASEGEYTGTITVKNQNGDVAEVALHATTYSPVEPDVFELATEMTFVENASTVTPDFTTLHDDYLLPNETKDNVAPDAVYTFSLEKEQIIDVMIDGTSSNYAIYKAETIGEGNGPQADNNDKGDETILGTTFSFDFNDNNTDGFYTINYDDYENYNWGIEDGALISYSYAYWYDENDEYNWMNIADERIVTNEAYTITPKTVLTFDAEKQGWGQEAVIIEVTKDGQEFIEIGSVVLNDPMTDYFELDARVDIGAIFTNKGIEFGDYKVVLHHNIAGIGYIKIDNLEMTERAGIYAAGDYYLVVAAKDAFTVNVTLVDTKVGIDEMTSSLNIYPNPANDILFIESDVNVEQVTIYSVTGVTVYDAKYGMQNVKLNVSDLKTGVYIIKTRTENNEIIKRFIKK